MLTRHTDAVVKTPKLIKHWETKLEVSDNENVHSQPQLQNYLSPRNVHITAGSNNRAVDLGFS